ncbi:transporter substrate-binding domain-containing protein [Xylanimonas allomyrinae]|nr:transporter substrate-binding domain-containing protein [Xylanimonas allomyrinae]
MFRIRKRILAAGAVAAAVTLTAACTSGATTGGKGTEGGAAGSHLTSVLSSHKLRVGVQSEAAPWGVQQSDGSYEGFDIDIANALGESLESEVVFIPVTNESRIPLLQSDKADVIIASFTATDERAQQVAFTVPYAAGGTLIAVPADSPVASYDDLAGKSVSASRGSQGEAALMAHLPDAQVAPFNTFADSVQALKSGKVDALIENNVVVPQLVAQDPRFRILEGPVLEPSLISMGVQQGDQVWLNYLDTFIRNYNISGRNDTASQKWLSQPLPEFLK